MFPSKNGKSYGSAYVAKKKDSMHSGDDPSAKQSPKATDMGFGQPSKGAEPKAASRTSPEGEALFSKANANAPDNNVATNPDNVDAASVVAEHGPAEHVHIHHDHNANKHQVISHHKDGHMHSSQHGSSQEAHKAAAELAGDQNNAAAAPTAAQAPESDGFSMPNLA
jgi:hypothetical protein